MPTWKTNWPTQMVDRSIGLTDMKEQLPDDVTVLVVRCAW